MSVQEPTPPPEVAGDDQAIARGLRISLVVLIAVAGLVAGVLWFVHRPVDAPPPKEVEVAPPVRRSVDVVLPEIPFTDVTAESGIDFERTSGATGERLLPETMGSGLAFLDYDGDADADLLLVDSRPWTPPADGDPSSLRLYRNDGDWRFTDVTTAVGLGPSFYGMGVAVGDVDADGDPDLFITAVGSNRLFQNDGGTFTEVAGGGGAAGGADDWSTSAAFFDADRDGDLDLVCCNYVEWSRTIDLELAYTLDGETRAYGPPMNYRGRHTSFFTNDGRGTFTDRSAEAGFHVENRATGAPVGKGLGALVRDVDEDGWLDVVVANDTVRNFLFHNQRDGTFREIGIAAGIGFDRDGRATGAMGIDAADFRGTGRLGFAVGNFANEMSSLYVVQRELRLADEAITEGLGAPSRAALTFGLFFFDADLDGRQDLLQANGHLESEISRFQPSQRYRQSAQLFWNAGPDARHAFVLLPDEAVGDLARPIVGRGTAYADVDGDGDLDVCVTQAEGSPLFLRNDQSSAHHWLRLRLVPEAGWDAAIGARVELETAAGVQRRVVAPAKSYLSSVEPVLTFGLGEATSVERLVVVWPDGTEQAVGVPAVDAQLTIRQD